MNYFLVGLLIFVLRVINMLMHGVKPIDIYDKYTVLDLIFELILWPLVLWDIIKSTKLSESPLLPITNKLVELFKK